MREREIERKLVSAVKSRGGICPKFVSPGFDGMPDRVGVASTWEVWICGSKKTGRKAQTITDSKTQTVKKTWFFSICIGWRGADWRDD